jgi:putative transposase
MSREAHVRFWEGVGVKLPRATHFLVLSERHLRHVLTRYFAYYHGARTHLSLEKDAPDARPIERPAMGTVVPIPEVGGLHHRYVRRAA